MTAQKLLFNQILMAHLEKLFSDRYCDDYASLYLLDFPSVVIQVRNFNGSCA